MVTFAMFPLHVCYNIIRTNIFYNKQWKQAIMEIPTKSYDQLKKTKYLSHNSPIYFFLICC